MNTSQDNSIEMSVKEWNKLSRKASERINWMYTSKEYDYETDTYVFNFAGESDKKAAIELCYHFGLN